MRSSLWFEIYLIINRYRLRELMIWVGITNNAQSLVFKSNDKSRVLKFELLLTEVAFNKVFKPMLNWHENGDHHRDGDDMDYERFLP